MKNKTSGLNGAAKNTIQTERVIISTLLYQPESAKFYKQAIEQGVKPDWFSDNPCKEIFEAVVKYYKDNPTAKGINPANIISILGNKIDLIGGQTAIMDLHKLQFEGFSQGDFSGVIKGLKEGVRCKTEKLWHEDSLKNKTALPLEHYLKKRGVHERENTAAQIKKGASEKKGESMDFITRAEIPQGSLTIIAGESGSGKTTSILWLLGDHYFDKGNTDKRPIVFFGTERRFHIVMVPRMMKILNKSREQLEDWIHYPEETAFPNQDPSKVSPRAAGPALIKAGQSGKYSAIFIDPFSNFTGGSAKNEVILQALEPFLSVLHLNTALIVQSQLRKEKKGTAMLDHVAGGGEFVGKADKVLYIRKGKEKHTRVMVKLKDSHEDDNDGGLLFRKDGDSMETIGLTGSESAILKKYAAPFPKGQETGPGATADDDEASQLQIREIVEYCMGKKDRDFKDYIDWFRGKYNLTSIETARRYLKQAGFTTKQVGFGTAKRSIIISAGPPPEQPPLQPPI